MRFFVKKPAVKPIVKMVVHGRRAYGEDFQEVTIGVEDDEIKVIDNRPVEAPPNRKPIIVPAMGEMAMEHVDFLLEGARKSQEYGGKHPSQMPLAEYQVWLNKMWQDYVAQKLAWFRGQTTIGAGGFFQRETPGRTHWTGEKR